MHKKNNHIKLLIATYALVLFTVSTNAQRVDVVDNKGTIQTVNNNTVTTSATAPANPVENDIWFDTSDANHTSTKINDGLGNGLASWVEFTPNKTARVFYPPSIAIPASSTGVKTPINLYDEYFSQFDSPAIGSTSAPAKIPTYLRSELYYYITGYDDTVLTIIDIDDNGLMQYSVDNIPPDDNTIINVVFVVK